MYKSVIILSVAMLIILNAQARPFGFQSVSHVNKAIKQQVRRAFIPILKSKNEIIHQAKLLNNSKDAVLFAFLTDGGYISVWDFKKGNEIISLPFKDLGLLRHIEFDSINKEIYLLTNNNKIYKKDIYSEEELSEYTPVPSIQTYSHFKSLLDLKLLTSNNKLILVSDNPNIKPIIETLENKIVAIDIDTEAKEIAIATKNELILLNLYKQQINKTQSWHFEQEIKNIEFDRLTNSLSVQFDATSWDEYGFAIIEKEEHKYKPIHYHSDKIKQIQFIDGSKVSFLTTNDNIKVYDFRQKEIKSTMSLSDYSPLNTQLIAKKNIAIMSTENKGLDIVNYKTQKKVLKMVSTKSGWAVLDNKSRYDGNAHAVKDISWEADDKMYELDRFSSNYFEPGLLAKVLDQQLDKLITEPRFEIERGLYLPPDIKLVVKDNNSEYAELSVEAKSKKANGDMSVLKLYHNGKRLLNKDIIISENQQTENEFNKKVWHVRAKLVNGKNSFLAQVSGWGDVLGESKESIIKVQKKVHPPKSHIKSIGINQYSSDELTLNFAESDATAFYNTILNYQKNRTRGLRGVNSLVLNAQASKNEILSKLDSIKSDANENDTLFVFMSGHGQAIDKQWYFLPQEAKTLLDPEHVKSVGLASSELAEKLIDIPIQQVVLIIDACQSGAVTESFNNYQQRRDLTGLSKDAGIHIMAATRADQLAPEYDQLGHGIFTYVLLSSLSKNKYGYYNGDKWPKDGNLMISEIKKYLEKYVPVTIRILERRRMKLFAKKGEKLQRGLGNQRTVVTPVSSTLGKDFKIF